MMQSLPLSTHALRLGLLAVVLSLLTVTTAMAQLPDRSTPPAVASVPTLDLAPLQSFTLSNGLKVLLIEKHQVPLIQVNLMIEAGSVDDPSDGVGLASLTAALLDEGAGSYSALDLAEAFEFLGARFFVAPDDHRTTVGLRVPVSRLEDALGLMADVVMRPQFPEEELDRLRLERLTGLIRQHDQPNAIASALFNQTLFGKDHPYGRASGGTEASLLSITRADVQGFYRAHYHPQNATLIVVGDATPDAITPALEAAFGTWAGDGNARGQQVATVPQVKGRTIYLVDKPGAAQSIIQIGRIGAARDTDDYYALSVFNTVLGGSFTSRLNQNLREDKGYTYGASSGFDYRLAPGPFQAGAAVFTDVTGPSLAEFMNEFDAILEPLPDEEFERAKMFLAMRFPTAFQSASQIASQIADQAHFNLPDDYFSRYTERILAVTKADVERVAQAYLDPDNLAIVVVGNAEVIEQQLRDLNLGPVEVLSVADVLGEVPVVGGGTE